jgi:serine/threonine-protein kinase
MGKIDMEWDDEDEKTHIFDKDHDPSRGEVTARPTPAPPGRALPPVVAPPHVSTKQTLLGMNVPNASPPSASPTPSPFRAPTLTPPPPGAAGGAFLRPSSGPQGSPAFPSPSSTLPMGMPGRPPPPQNLPPPPIAPSFRTSDVSAPTMPPIGNRMEATALVRPPEPKRPQWLLGAVVGAVALALGVFYLMPHAGQMAVNVADSKGGAVPHLEIYVDGKKQCDSAPCLVGDMSPGSHTVRVEATGFERPADKAVAVESRRDTTVDFVLAASKAGFKITGTQPAVRLFVDDREVGPLPQELRDVPPGTHQLKVVGAADRYAPFEKTITVNKDEIQDLGVVSLKVVKGKATISLGTPGAKVFMVSGSDRRELTPLPISVDIPDTSKQWSIVASKPGYNDYTQVISFDDGQAEKAFTVTLDPSTKSPPAFSGGYTAPAPQPAHATPSPAAPSPPSDSSGSAFLNINSIPASSVILDGQLIGSTPKLRYSVSPGTHSVTFLNADQNFKKQISVTVGAGETKAAIGKN